WSYHFHGYGVNAAYGINSLYVQGRWLYLVQGTPWQVPDAVRELHVGMFREFFARNIWRGRMSPYALDRGIATPRTCFGGSFLGAGFFGLRPDPPPQDKAVFAASVADCLKEIDPDGTARLDGSLGPELLLAAMPDPANADLSVLDGMRYYPESQYLLV